MSDQAGGVGDLGCGTGANASAVICDLRLYVTGQTARSRAALANLQALFEGHLAGRCRIEVIDVLEQPELAAADNILAIPTLVRRLPLPVKRLIGNLADTDRVLEGLELSHKTT